MNMENKRLSTKSKMLGFLGAEKYDILLYLSKILCRLNQKVLLVDYSENRALTYCIPAPEGEQKLYTVQKSRRIRYQIEGEQDKQEECISYQGIDFVIEPMYGSLMELSQSYDVILVDFGFQSYSKLITACDKIYLCLDQQLHHIMQLKPLKQMEAEIKEKCYLLFRQVYDCKISAAYLLEELSMDLPKEQVFLYYEEAMDMKYCIDSQYNHTFYFMKISRELKSCLLFLIRTMLPELPDHDVKSAYRMASRQKVNVSSSEN